MILFIASFRTLDCILQEITEFDQFSTFLFSKMEELSESSSREDPIVEEKERENTTGKKRKSLEYLDNNDHDTYVECVFGMELRLSKEFQTILIYLRVSDFIRLVASSCFGKDIRLQ